METASDDDVNRAGRYSLALEQLRLEGDPGASRFPDEVVGTMAMMRMAVLNAAMQRDDDVAARIARRIKFSSEVDLVGLVKRIRLRVIMNRLD